MTLKVVKRKLVYLSPSEQRRREEERRRQNNKELVGHLKNRTYIPPSVPVEQTWFPPRPIIEKDQDAINRLYNKE